MKDVIVFAGTSEGRQLYDFCVHNRIDALFCVATDYGREVLGAEIGDELCKPNTCPIPDDELCKPRTSMVLGGELCKPIVRAGRLLPEEMESLFLEEKPRIVVDATHPYAAQATEHIRMAVQRYRQAEGIEEQVYYRVLRDLCDQEMPPAQAFEDMEQAVAYLNRTTGNILVTTGSKEAEKLCKLNNCAERVYLRILPNPGILQECLDKGFPASHMICMQGPFTEEMNRATMEQYEIRYLLTKQSGGAGGYPEKWRAAQAAGAELVAVLPPKEVDGFSVEEAEEKIWERTR